MAIYVYDLQASQLATILSKSPWAIAAGIIATYIALVDGILVLKKHRNADIKEKLDVLNNDLYEAGKTFFDQKYVSADERNAAFKRFKETCEALVTQAEADFADTPGLWPQLKLVLNKIVGVVLAIGTVGAAVYLFGGFEAYKVRFFNSPPMSQVWRNAGIKNSLFALKGPEKPGLFTQIEEDISKTPKKLLD